MPTIDIDDTTLHYERSGHGPGLLFVHGLCGDAESFADQARRLSDRYTCVRYDRRGHSRSAWGEAAITVTRHADDAAALIEALDLAPCLVVSSSGGANVAVDLTLRHGHLLRGAVFSEPPLFSLDPEAGRTAMGQIGPLVDRAEATGDRRAFVDGFFPIVCPGLWSAVDEAVKDRYRANADIGLVDLRTLSPDVSAEDLAAVTVPALVVSGDASPPFHMAIAKRLAAALPDSRLVTLEDCGHVTYFEQPDGFERAVAAFAAEIDRRTFV